MLGLGVGTPLPELGQMQSLASALGVPTGPPLPEAGQQIFGWEQARFPPRCMELPSPPAGGHHSLTVGGAGPVLGSSAAATGGHNGGFTTIEVYPLSS